MATVQNIPSKSTSGSLLQSLLEEQQSTTAVERFAQYHAESTEPLLRGHYRDLIPLSKPREGEQYAFEVDLDVCSGCKACVAACNNLNGLDADESWRNVGLLHGGTPELPILKHVTTACHHCVEPGCLEGCPVLAYEKDPETGIVRHLDDQCFGCQYCILMCPYEVPQFSPSRGIVRKCDMCHDRLADGEAPACVQSCPNQAIRIRTVEVEDSISKSHQNKFLPTTPDAGITCPTTIYRSSHDQLDILQAADGASIVPQHGHPALVFMLVLTQLSVGGLFLTQLLGLNNSNLSDLLLPAVLVSFLVGFVGMHLAVLHLGRPLYAYRALLGLRSSWLSREILGFGVFAGSASAYLIALYFAPKSSLVPLLGWFSAMSGLLAVFCSVMIYVKTKRPYWNLGRTASTFFLTCAVLGFSFLLVVSLVAPVFQESTTSQQFMQELGRLLCVGIIVSTSVKLLLEASVLRWMNDIELTPLKRTGVLLTDQLRYWSLPRLALGLFGGILLPLILISLPQNPEGPAMPLILLSSLILVVLLAGELLERHLFFVASSPPKMPGGIAA